jgi:8-oxo-dGTP pyrophosphatase MutT (NUDIX family)
VLPSVTAVIHDGPRFLLARQVDSERWSLVGGGVEPGEEPRDALVREVREELGCAPVRLEVLDAYGGPDLMTAHPNGDQVAYITIAYLCTLPRQHLELDGES